MIFRGASTALITPFHADFSVNWEKFAELIERQIEGGIQAIIINGTTGEASTLAKEERIDCLKFALDITNRRVPIIAGTGSNNTAEAVAATKAAQEAGADAALMVTPYYNKTSQAGLIAHYTHVADQTDIPILLYAVPGRTSQPMTAETVVELAKHPRIVGIKDATSDSAFAMDILRQVNNPRFALYSGNDDVVVPYLAAGAVGVISTIGNLLPAPMQAICAAAERGDWALARKIQFELLPVIQGIFSEVNPIGTKGGMNIMGLEVGLPRLPLVDMGKDTHAKLAQAIADYDSL